MRRYLYLAAILIILMISSGCAGEALLSTSGASTTPLLTKISPLPVISPIPPLTSTAISPPTPTEALPVKAEPVTIAQVLADPGRYAGTNIRVEGYLFSGWEWFGIAEGYKSEENRPLQSTGGWISIRDQPKNTAVDIARINKLYKDIKEQLYIDKYATPQSLFGKVQVTGEFQFFDAKEKYMQIAPIDMSILPWVPPPSSTAPKVEGRLTFSEPPVLNKPTQMIYSFWLSERSQQDNADVSAGIKIPDTFNLLDGSLQWQGKLAKGVKNEMKTTVKPVIKGVFEMTAGVSTSGSAGNNPLNLESETLYALVLSDRGFLSDVRSGLPGEITGQITAVTYQQEDAEVSLDLSLPRPPALNQTAEISLVASARVDAPQARIDIQLPPALSLVSGDLVWKGDMAKGDRVELKALVKATAEGKWSIHGTAINISALKPGYGVSSATMLILYIFKDGADVLEITPPAMPK